VGNGPTNATDPNGLAEERDSRDKKFWRWFNERSDTGPWHRARLSKAQVARCKVWKELDLEVYVSPGFNHDTKIDGFMNSVGNWYAKYGIVLYWRVTTIKRKPTHWTPASFTPDGRASHFWNLYFRDKEGSEGPDLWWFWDTFPHKPTLFLIRNSYNADIISLPFYMQDEQGITFKRTFIFVPKHDGIEDVPYDLPGSDKTVPN
jgi:hypothetical protein